MIVSELIINWNRTDCVKLENNTPKHDMVKRV
jgi:hypothetical protein